jgi:hypothetical protein
MHVADKPDIATAFRDGSAIERAMALAVREAIRRHKCLGQSIAVWRDGQVVVVPPEEIPEDPQPRT